MEFRPTFYSISGFLIPGIVFVTTLALEIDKSRGWLFAQIRNHAVSPGDSTAVGIIITTTLIAIALSVCFVIGSVISELYQLFYRFGIRKRRFFFQKRSIHDNTHALAKATFDQGSLDCLLANDLDARETFAYQQTCGLDLHWFAGRNRMVGGSGFSCLLAGKLKIKIKIPASNRLLTPKGNIGALLCTFGLHTSLAC